MKYCLILLTLIFLFVPFNKVSAQQTTSSNIITGVQLPNANPITRLIQSVRYPWVKYQYVLGSDQPIEDWIKQAHSAPDGGFKVLLSVAKNNVGIPSLKNDTTEVSHQYCWYDDELADIHDSKGNFVRKENTPANNGYQQFMKAMDQLGNRLKSKGVTPEAIEIWNEPNLADEWSNQGLGDISPQNYAIFLECGSKGLKRGAGYTGPIISAALAPLAPYDDLRYFNEFVAAKGLTGPRYNGQYAVSAVGWHGNIVKNIPPANTNVLGFQRVKQIFPLLNVNGKNLPIWMTEYGWARDQAHIDRETQAQYTVDAVAIASRLGHIDAMFVFNFGFAREAKQFEEWDIEGIQSNDCVSLEKINEDTSNASTDYIAAPSLNSDDRTAQIEMQGLIPPETNQSYEDLAKLNFDKNVDPDTKQKALRADVKTSFFVGGFESIVKKLFGCNPIGSLINFCSPVLNAGTGPLQQDANAQTTQSSSPDGQSTEYLTARSYALANSFRPSDIKTTPAKQDCNIGKFNTQKNFPGNDKLNQVSTNFGTNTGYYRADLPLLGDHDELVQDQETKQNIEIYKKIFTQDQRVPDIEVSKKEFCLAHYPDGVGCPYVDGQ